MVATDRGSPSKSASVQVLLEQQRTRDPPRVEFHFAEPFRVEGSLKVKHVVVAAGAQHNHLVARLNASSTSRNSVLYSFGGDIAPDVRRLVSLSSRGELFLVARPADAIRQTGRRTLRVPVVATDAAAQSLYAPAVVLVELSPAGAFDGLSLDSGGVEMGALHGTTPREPHGFVGWLARHSNAIVLACFVVILVCLLAFVLLLLLFYVRSKTGGASAARTGRRRGIAMRIADCLCGPAEGARRNSKAPTKTAATRGATAAVASGTSTRLALVSGAGEKLSARRTFSNNSDDVEVQEHELDVEAGGNQYQQQSHLGLELDDDDYPDAENETDAGAAGDTPSAVGHIAPPTGTAVCVL